MSQYKEAGAVCLLQKGQLDVKVRQAKVAKRYTLYGL